MQMDIFHSAPECEIVSIRTFNTRRDLVFKAWEDPNHLKNWWGPKGFTNTFHEFDFREGGSWKFVMHGPDKGNYNNACEFIKIDKPSLIAWKRYSKPLFSVVALFEEISSNETKVVFKMVFNSAEECAKLKPYVVDKNEENFDRLEKELNIIGDEQG